LETKFGIDDILLIDARHILIDVLRIH